MDENSENIDKSVKDSSIIVEDEAIDENNEDFSSNFIQNHVQP